jgi:hypothetical protein
MYSAKKHTHTMTRGAHKTRMAYLTLVSSGVQRGLGAKLSASSVDRRTTVGASLSCWKEVERASECRDANAKKAHARHSPTQ